MKIETALKHSESEAKEKMKAELEEKKKEIVSLKIKHEQERLQLLNRKGMIWNNYIINNAEN